MPTKWLIYYRIPGDKQRRTTEADGVLAEEAIANFRRPPARDQGAAGQGSRQAGKTAGTDQPQIGPSWARSAPVSG